jgi:hypothetical protein
VLRDLRAINLKANTANGIIGMIPSSDLEEMVSIPPITADATKSLFDMARKVGTTLSNQVTGDPVIEKDSDFCIFDTKHNSATSTSKSSIYRMGKQKGIHLGV